MAVEIKPPRPFARDSPGRDVNALDAGKLRDALPREPIEKLRRCPRIGAARVCVADIGGEEFEEAIGSTGAGRGDEGGGV